MACRLLGAKPLSESMLEYCYFKTKEQISVKSEVKSYIFIQENELENGGHFLSASTC